MHRPTQKLERALRKNGATIIAGCDEAGRGAWAGPLVAAAVVLPKNVRLPGVRDSKLLTERMRERLYDVIVNKALAWNIAVLSVKRVDRHGVHKANLAALCQAVRELSVSVDPHIKNFCVGVDHALIDAFHVESMPCPSTSVLHGDRNVLSIAAASVLAKVTRDRIMIALHKRFPQYGFDRHKGYGTPEHQRALERFGPSPLHRRSFAPIAALTVPARV